MDQSRTAPPSGGRHSQVRRGSIEQTGDVSRGISRGLSGASRPGRETAGWPAASTSTMMASMPTAWVTAVFARHAPRGRVGITLEQGQRFARRSPECRVIDDEELLPAVWAAPPLVGAVYGAGD